MAASTVYCLLHLGRNSDQVAQFCLSVCLSVSDKHNWNKLAGWSCYYHTVLNVNVCVCVCVCIVVVWIGLWFVQTSSDHPLYHLVFTLALLALAAFYTPDWADMAAGCMVAVEWCRLPEVTSNTRTEQANLQQSLSVNVWKQATISCKF